MDISISGLYFLSPNVRMSVIYIYHCPIIFIKKISKSYIKICVFNNMG